MKINCRKGQSISEYLILTALIAVASIGVIQVLSANIRSRIANIARAIGGENGNVLKAQDVKREHYEIKDLGNFSNGNINSEE